jgi:hypothetical protein
MENSQALQHTHTIPAMLENVKYKNHSLSRPGQKACPSLQNNQKKNS